MLSQKHLVSILHFPPAFDERLKMNSEEINRSDNFLTTVRPLLFKGLFSIVFSLLIKMRDAVVIYFMKCRSFQQMQIFNSFSRFCFEITQKQ